MRVISGFLKGREIKGYNIDGTRPTMDRVKMSLFGSIQNYIDDSIVLDLFAGSGSLGIEAISNGADKCYFVDNNKKCINTIKNNINNFDIANKCNIMLCDYNRALDIFKNDSIKFDIIFIDPPYKYNVMNELLDTILRYDLLNNNGIVVLEYKVDNLDDISNNYTILKCKKYGDKYISIFKLEK